MVKIRIPATIIQNPGVHLKLGVEDPDMKYQDVKYEPLLAHNEVEKMSNVKRRIWSILMIFGFLCLMSILILSKNFNFLLFRSSGIRSDASLRYYISQNTRPEYFLSSRLAVNARLGNHLFELISLFGISKTLNRTFLFWVQNEKYANMLDQVQRILPGLMDKIKIVYAKVPEGFQTTHFPNSGHTYSDPMVLENRPDTLLHLSGAYYQSWKYFSHYREEVLSFLRPPKNFTNLPVSNGTHKVNCVHIRRGDFISAGRFTGDEKFIRKAVEFVEKTEPSTPRSLVLFGDDRKFMSSIFAEQKEQKSIFVSSNSPQDDLLYSSQHCDTLLFTAPSSTFGWWMGYLSKGNKVFYTDPESVQGSLIKTHWIIPDDFFPGHWVPVRVS